MTIPSAELRENDILRLEGDFFKVLAANLHTGGGKSGAMMHAKLRSLSSGHIAEKRWAPVDKIEKVNVERVPMQYLYADADICCFMNPQSFEQVAVPKNSIGPAALYLKEEMTLTVELYEGKPIAVDYPKVVEIKVTATGGSLKGNAAFKEAILENKVSILVPQFIKEGDAVRIDVETQKYIDRVKK